MSSTILSSTRFYKLLIPVLFLFLLFASCNQDGVGIYYQISQEEAQADSEISESPIYRVVEVDSASVFTIYALAGRSVWRQSGSDWSKISGDNFVYNIVIGNPGSGSEVLYGNFNNEESVLGDGRILPYNGSTWDSAVFTYNDDIDLFQIEDEAAYILEIGAGGVNEVQSTTDLSSLALPTDSFTAQPAVDFLDGAYLNTTYFVISSDTIYSSTDLSVANSLTALPGPTFDVGVNGYFRSIVTDSGSPENIYLATSTGQIYTSIDGSAWTLLTDIGDSPVRGSMVVAVISGTDYLIIGTDNGYYEMEILPTVGDSEVVGPTATADTSGPSEFSASYPQLAASLVNDVYIAPSDGTLYLATQEGLWKHNSDLSFSRQ